MIKKFILFSLVLSVSFGLFGQVNLAKNQKVEVSSGGTTASFVVDGQVSEKSQWKSSAESEPWLILSLGKKQLLGGVHIYFGQALNKQVEAFRVEFSKDGAWQAIPSAIVSGNKFEAVALAFDATVSVFTDSLRFVFTKSRTPDVTVREISVWPYAKMGIPALGAEVSGYNALPEPYVPKIYINQSGYNIGKPKRFTAPLLDDGTSFRIVEVGTQQTLFSGTIQKNIGDFTAFNPKSDKDYVIVADTFKSFPFRVGQWWIERVTYQNAMNFMIDSRHYVGNYTLKCSGSYGWRDDSHFGWELHTLVPQYLSNPTAYERMPKQVTYQAPTDTTLWGALKPYDESAPDIVKLMHWGADVIVSQKLTHEHFKGQLAYFLYAWPYIKQWLPQQNFDVVMDYALKVWQLDKVDKWYAYNESNGHNMLALKTKLGTTKGALPPGASVIPNLMMYEVAKRTNRSDAATYFDAAYNQTKWLVDSLDWNNPMTTKGQRMSEFITMTSLAYMLQQYPEKAPAGLKKKMDEWADVLIRRSNNMWDFRKLDDYDQWCPTGTSPQHWNETGNVVGLPSAIFSMVHFIDDPAKIKRLMEIAYAHLDNAFGRNPCGRHCSYDAPREIEGVDLGWYHQYPGGIGQLSEARFVLDGSPKNAHYPYHPERGDIGWTEGWVSFNVAYNLSLTYMSWFDTEWSATRTKNLVTLRLKVPLNFDYKTKECVWVDLQDATGKTTKLMLTEESENSPYFSITMKAPAKKSVVSYGYGYFKKSLAIPEKSTPTNLDKNGNLISMDEVDISSMVQQVPEKNIFSDAKYNIWCGSVVKGTNGKFYMFYSRWPRSEGHYAWVPSSEICLAKSDKPEGPYKHVKVVLPRRGPQYWDGVTTHNPAAIVYKGKYYLYYMGTTGTKEVKMPASMGDPNWWQYRNNQRIGVAVADDPEGAWKRFDQPVIDVSPDSTAFDALLMSNPAITVDQKGRAILVYKQVAKNGTMRGGKVRFGVAFANSLLGPYTKCPTPIFESKDGEKSWMIAEDPFIWNYKGTNYAIVTDVVGLFTNKEAALALLKSKDGISWEPAKYPKVLPRELQLENGTMTNDKLERPCLYMEKGVPKLLFGAQGFNKRAYSVNMAVPLEWKK